MKEKLDRAFDPGIWARASEIAGGYRLILEREPGGFLGRALEMPTVLAHGRSAGACEKSTREALTVAIATMIERDQAPPVGTGSRSAQVNIRLTAEEKVLLEDHARRAGFRGLSDFMRHAALSIAGQRSA